jgi:hypothetical protein
MQTRVAAAPSMLLNPTQQRVLDELLAVNVPRPPADPSAGARLRQLLEDRTVRAAATVGARSPGLTVNKSALDALGCDGRYLDWLEQDFSWTPAMVRGTLAHTAIAIDLAGDRRHDPATVLAHAWDRFVGSGRPAGAFLAGLGGVEADALRAEAAALLVEFREAFPPLPPEWHPRLEPELRVRLHGGRVVLVGRPDLLVGRATRDRRRMLLIDLKSGRRRGRDRADMRLYALLVTVKYGIAPFRAATFYLAEGAWDHEDIDGDTLHAAARSVIDGVNRAVALTTDAVAGQLRLVAGPACRWCGRAPTCPAATQATRIVHVHSAVREPLKPHKAARRSGR